MPTVWATTRGGETREVRAKSGISLKDNLKRGGMDEILGLCGGCASCGTCHVYVAEDWLDHLPPIKAEEETILAFSDWREPNSRLSCQIRMTDELEGLCVTVAPED
ncbi:MAG TPA: 2Fe-2S iron-sulfur cluster-binding protein [Sphingomicrobium sp.]|nr:2Fe-2S iron-sulfur cluster-binding protein [Sphingomicrobium sp.]